VIKQFLKEQLIKEAFRKNGPGPRREFTGYELGKEYRDLRLSMVRHVKDFILITIGIFSASFGFKGFLLTNHFIDGGATGISLLLTQLTGLPLYLTIVCINIPFIILAYQIIDRSIAFKTSLAIVGLAVCLVAVDFPDVTSDNLLVAVFGGFFLGVGKGLAVRGGAVLDGTEVLALYLSRRLRITLGDIVIGINIIIFSAAGYFLSVEIALYSMITYLSASKTLDFIIEGIDEYIGVTIISSHSEEMRQMVIKQVRRGVTIYKGKRGYGTHGESSDMDIIFTVVTRLELNKLNSGIKKIDENAFVVMNSVKDTKGGMIKKRPFKS